VVRALFWTWETRPCNPRTPVTIRIQTVHCAKHLGMLKNVIQCNLTGTLKGAPNKGTFHFNYKSATEEIESYNKELIHLETLNDFW
jgi:hypothetical protein